MKFYVENLQIMCEDKKTTSLETSNQQSTIYLRSSTLNYLADATFKLTL